jgi:hypothetical protein
MILSQTRGEILKTLQNEDKQELGDLAEMFLRALKKVQFKDDAVIKLEIKPKEVMDLIQKGVIRKGDTIVVKEKAPVQSGTKILFYVLKDSEWEVIAVKDRKWIGIQWKDQTGWVNRKYVEKKTE